MPKGILEFNLPEEREEHLTAIHAGDYKLTIWELDQFLRAKIKHSDEPVDAYEEIRQKLYELLGGIEL